MTEPRKVSEDGTPRPLTAEERREFLRRARDFAVTAPATALLLQAAVRPAQAQPYGGGATTTFTPIFTTTTTFAPTTTTTTTFAPTTTTRNTLRPSDRRLKADIERIGALPNGIGLYTFRYAWSEERFVGVMADEVAAVLPAAVSRHDSGYLMVDYGRLLG